MPIKQKLLLVMTTAGSFASSFIAFELFARLWAFEPMAALGFSVGYFVAFVWLADAALSRIFPEPVSERIAESANDSAPASIDELEEKYREHPHVRMTERWRLENGKRVLKFRAFELEPKSYTEEHCPTTKPEVLQ